MWVDIYTKWAYWFQISETELENIFWDKLEDQKEMWFEDDIDWLRIMNLWMSWAQNDYYISTLDIDWLYRSKIEIEEFDRKSSDLMLMKFCKKHWIEYKEPKLIVSPFLCY